jgi:hypothetical protein
MQELIKKNRTKIRANDIKIKEYKNAVYYVVQFIDDYELLKKAIYDRLSKYVDEKQNPNVDIDPDIKKEYENQKRYLENSVNSLKKRLEKETKIHKEDNMNIMRENIKLIQEISFLRKDVKALESKLKSHTSKGEGKGGEGEAPA